jgi:hypothetical protein
MLGTLIGSLGWFLAACPCLLDTKELCLRVMDECSVTVVWHRIKDFQQIAGHCFVRMDNVFATNYTSLLFEDVLHLFVGVLLSSHKMSQSYSRTGSCTDFLTVLDKFPCFIIYVGCTGQQINILFMISMLSSRPAFG